jgi:hypothetical protein
MKLAKSTHHPALPVGEGLFVYSTVTDLARLRG